MDPTSAGRASARDLPPPGMLEAMVPHLSETVELVDPSTGLLLWRLGAPDGMLSHGRGASGSVFEHVHPDDLPRMMDLRAQVVASQPGWRGSMAARLRHSDGSWRAAVVEVVSCVTDPVLRGVIVTTRPLLAGPLADDEHPVPLQGEAMVESIAEAVPVALVVLDGLGRMEYANQVAREVCDLPDGPTYGRYLPDLASERDRGTVTRVVNELLDQVGSRTVVFETRGWQGRRETKLLEARLQARGTGGQPSTIIVTLDDVTETQRTVNDLRQRANYDPLTGLLNRAALLEEMEARLARGSLTAIYCDLDGFKAVNDTLGHAGGDELLVEVAKLLTSMARSTDAIGRLGGDEFVIVCDGLTRPHTTNLIARLGDALDVGLGVRISVGVAGSKAGGSAKDLLARADRAMYENKRRIQRSTSDEPTLR